MKKAVILALSVLGLLVLINWIGQSDAAPAPKVFVCKYVGTPGVDERLQTGQNPISVSSNAIKDYNGVGSYFNDAQGRSLVIAIDTGQDEPECPVPQNPPEEEEPPVEEKPDNPNSVDDTPSRTPSVQYDQPIVGK